MTPVFVPAFTDEDLELLAQLIPIAVESLHETLTSVHKAFPEAALCESLRRWIEQGVDLQEKLEARP